MVGVAAPAPADANGPAVIVVDDDGFGTAADCDASSPAIPTNIQAGVDAAIAGDMVFVCPGVYPQTTTPGITIGKALTITSGGAAGVVVSGSTKNGSVVNGRDLLFSVTASGVTIENLTIDLGDDDSDYDVGVFTDNFVHVDGLVVQDSIFRFAAFGNATGEQLIHLGGGTGHTVQRNNFETASGNSVLYLGERTVGTNTDLTFSGNTIAPVSDANGGGTAIGAWGAVVDSTFDSNTFTETGYGIWLGAGLPDTDNVAVTNNTFTASTSTTYAALLIVSEEAGSTTSNIDVSHNVFTGGAAAAVSIGETWGWALGNVDGATITVNRNHIAGNADGLLIGSGVTGTVNSQCNWWGDASGPSGVGPGTGDSVTAGTTFAPWLTTTDLNSPCPDADGDGILNHVDNCPLVANGRQNDFDGDGLGNRCDPDWDGDGVDNGVDAFPWNPAKSDVDSDGDGVGDSVDNCPVDPNGRQNDFDGDGLGNKCDDDVDGDGVDNGVDAFPWNPAKSDIDSDGDGVGDSVDNCPFVNNGRQNDFDGDGLGNRCDSDWDDDGVDNGDDAFPWNPAKS
jgi:hypothetical protein